MFREMRRSRQALPKEECCEILNRANSGVLALCGDDGYPYALPLSYCYEDGHIYFHSGKRGHKIDAIKRSPKASFCVIDQDQVIPAEYTTYYRSVIAFGTIRFIEDPDELWAAIDKLAARYAPNDTQENRHAVIRRELPPLCMMDMKIEHLTGKESLELLKKRNKEN